MSIYPPTTDVSSVATYMASTDFFTPPTSTADFLEIKGSATKTIEVLKIISNSSFGSNDVLNDVRLLKRSTADTGGTAVSYTPVALDSNNAAATSVVKAYTANPTSGTLVGRYIILPAKTIYNLLAHDYDMGQVLFDSDKFGQPIVLRGAAQSLVLNGNGVTIANTWSFTVVLRER